MGIRNIQNLCISPKITYVQFCSFAEHSTFYDFDMLLFIINFTQLVTEI